MISLKESILGSTKTGASKYLDIIDNVLKKSTENGHWRRENSLIWAIYLHSGKDVDFKKYYSKLRECGSLADSAIDGLEEFYNWMKTNTEARVTWNSSNDIIITCKVGNSNFNRELNKIFCRYYDNVVVQQ